jgi:hypothetical protein
MGNVLLGGNDENFTSIQEIINPKETVITNFQDGHGFAKGGAAGTFSDDTTDYQIGSQSLKCITDGAGGACYASKTDFAAFNLLNQNLVLWVKVSNITNLSYLWVYVSSDTDFTNRKVYKIENDKSQLKAGVWSRVSLTDIDATITGTPDLTAIVAVQVRVGDANSTAITVNYGGISNFTNLLDEAICSITFDDNWLSQYTEAYKLMSQYRLKGTIYSIPEKVGTTNYMTLAQCKAVQNDGWDISAHSSLDLNTLNANQCENELVSIKKWLIENGFNKGVNDFAFPLGHWDSTNLPIVQKYFRSARTIVSFGETISPGDMHRLRIRLITNTTSTATIQGWIDAAILAKSWLILCYHKLVESPTVDTEHSITYFATEMAYINSSGIKVLPVSEVLNSIPYLLNKPKSARRWIKPFHSDMATTSQEYTAGRVLMVLFEVPEPVYVDGISVINGATADGNLTVGITRAITEEVGTGSVLVVESASTAQSGTNTAQFIPLTPTYLKAGRYFACVESSSNTATYMRIANQRQVLGWNGYYARSGGYGALTNPSPEWTETGSAVPAIYVRCKPIQ